MTQELPKAQRTLFTRYDLTLEEELSGVQFTETQRMFMQNLLATAAEEKVRLKYDPQNPQTFLQREAELQGNILTLETLLDSYEMYLESKQFAPPSIDSNTV